MIIINSHATGLFLYPLKTSEDPSVSHTFQEFIRLPIVTRYGNKCNRKFVNIYCAVGHDKYFTDMISIFEVKTILRRVISINSIWFADSRKKQIALHKSKMKE